MADGSVQETGENGKEVATEFPKKQHLTVPAHTRVKAVKRVTVKKVIVEGAGHDAVNRVYVRDGYNEHACKYSREGEYKGQVLHFCLFLCTVSNQSKHWYISIVPPNGQLGTNCDVDFYSVPACSEELPPLTGWNKSYHGRILLQNLLLDAEFK